MSYIFNTLEDQQSMLEAVGAESIEDLFSMVPSELRLKRGLEIPAALSELELEEHVGSLAERNLSAAQSACFLGAGSYDHFIPSVVDAICSRGEFLTAYTPYQAEASQGSLQAFFEYQTLITRLTGMDVSNASLYDAGSAVAEAVLMSISATGGRNRVVTAASVHPEYREILATYSANLDVEVVTVATPAGTIAVDELAARIDERTACVLVQHPNFFGCLEDVENLAAAAHERGALLVVSVDPISLGVLKRPSEYGADIVVAEGQSLGSPMAFGGPYLGILACREQFVRRLPGRIVGQTADRRGKRCWVLTLQTREQHIRRERATSNICTNQGLLALRATVYLSLMGPRGLREVAELCVRKARYAADTITSSPRFQLAFDRPTFKEFVVRDGDDDVSAALAAACREGILAGVPLGRWYEELQDCFLVAVTEKRRRQQIDQWARCLNQNETPRTAVHA